MNRQFNSKLLEKQVNEEEKELKCIKEALENGNLNSLNYFLLNTDKIKPIHNLKLPERLSEKEIEKKKELEMEKREEKHRLKEIERLEKTTRKMLGRRKRPITLNAVQKHILQKTIILPPKKQKLLKINDVLPSNIKLNNCSANRKIQSREKIEIECDIDNQKDEEYFNQLTQEEKAFTIENNPDLFTFFNSISLARYIGNFNDLGYENIKDIINSNQETIKEISFLNPMQKTKLFNRIKEIKVKQEFDSKESKRNDKYLKHEEKIRYETKECGINAKCNQEITPNKQITCCWNCFKQLFVANAIDIVDEKYICKLKSFCSKKCLEVFKQSQVICFECKNTFFKHPNKEQINSNNHDFCSSDCQAFYVNKFTDNPQDRFREDEEDNFNDEYEKEEYYDPMEDL